MNRLRNSLVISEGEYGVNLGAIVTLPNLLLNCTQYPLPINKQATFHQRLPFINSSLD